MYNKVFFKNNGMQTKEGLNKKGLVYNRMNSVGI